MKTVPININVGTAIEQARIAWAKWEATNPLDDPAFNAAGEAHREAMRAVAWGWATTLREAAE